MGYDFVCSSCCTVGSKVLVNNAVVKRVNTSLLLHLQFIARNIRVHLNTLVKLSVYNYAGITPSYAGITSSYGAKVTLAS